MDRRPRSLSRQTLIVLEALASSGGAQRYGLELASATGLQSGSLYPILARLLERGYLEGEWQPPARPGRPARHAYRITGAGRAALNTAARPANVRAEALAT